MALSTTAPPVATQKLVKEDLVKYLASGCKPREAWRYCSLHSIADVTADRHVDQ